MKNSELYTGEILTYKNKDYFVVLNLPETKARSTRSGVYKGMKMYFSIETGKRSVLQLDKSVPSKHQFTKDEKQLFLTKLLLQGTIQKAFPDQRFTDIENVVSLNTNETVKIQGSVSDDTFSLITKTESGFLLQSAIKVSNVYYILKEQSYVAEDNLFVGKKVSFPVLYPTVQMIDNTEEKVEDIVNSLKKKLKSDVKTRENFCGMSRSEIFCLVKNSYVYQLKYKNKVYKSKEKNTIRIETEVRPMKEIYVQLNYICDFIIKELGKTF